MDSIFRSTTISSIHCVPLYVRVKGGNCCWPHFEASVQYLSLSMHWLTLTGKRSIDRALCLVLRSTYVVIPYKSQVFKDMGQTSVWVTVNEIHGRMQILYSNVLNVSRSCNTSRYVFRIVFIWRDISLSIRPSWKVNALWSWYVCRVHFRHMFFLFRSVSAKRSTNISKSFKVLLISRGVRDVQMMRLRRLTTWICVCQKIMTGWQTLMTCLFYIYFWTIWCDSDLSRGVELWEVLLNWWEIYWW